MGEVLSPYLDGQSPQMGGVLLLSVTQTSSEKWVERVPCPCHHPPPAPDSAPEMRKPRSVHCQPLWHSPPEGSCPSILAPTHCSDHAWPSSHFTIIYVFVGHCLLPVTCTRPQTPHRQGHSGARAHEPSLVWHLLLNQGWAIQPLPLGRGLRVQTFWRLLLAVNILSWWPTCHELFTLIICLHYTLLLFQPWKTLKWEVGI